MSAQHKHGCCVDEACTNNNCMELPKGKTCGDCFAFRHCAGMYGVKEDRTSCDFFPRRFKEPTPTPAKGLVMSQNPNTIAALSVDRLVRCCHEAAFSAGWWLDPKTGIHISSNPLCFSNKLMLIVSEVSEAMEGDRKNLMDDKLPHRPMREVELADALIRICDLAGAYQLDLGGAVAEKLAFNATRPDHKPENRVADGGKAY